MFAFCDVDNCPLARMYPGRYTDFEGVIK